MAAAAAAAAAPAIIAGGAYGPEPVEADFCDNVVINEGKSNEYAAVTLSILGPNANDSPAVRTVLAAREKAIEGRAVGAVAIKRKRPRSYTDPILRITEDWSLSFAERARKLTELAATQQIQQLELEAAQARARAAARKRQLKREEAEPKNRKVAELRKKGDAKRSPHVRTAAPVEVPQSVAQVVAALLPKGSV